MNKDGVAMKTVYLKLKEMVEDHQVGASGIVVVGDPEVCPTGTKFIVNEAGEIVEGQIDAELLNSLREDLLQIIQSKSTKTLTLRASSDETHSSASLKIFIDPIFPQTRLIILGGGHIALPLVKMGKFLGFQITVVDDRPSFANRARFAEADEVICEEFEKAIKGLSIDRNTYVVIVTRGHRYDKECLANVLECPVKPAYIGMIGSRRKVAAIIDDLKESGVTDEVLNTVYAPIGLDIGAQTPEEISLSILSEMVMIKHYGYSDGLKNQTRGKKIDG